MHIQIDIETDSRMLDADLMESMSLRVGQSHTIPGDALLIYEGSRGQKAFGFSETLTFLLQNFGFPIITSVVGSWLYEKLRGRAKTLRIQGKEIQIDKEEIIRSLDEEIKRVERIHIIDGIYEKQE